MSLFHASTAHDGVQFRLIFKREQDRAREPLPKRIWIALALLALPPTCLVSLVIVGDENENIRSNHFGHVDQAAKVKTA